MKGDMKTYCLFLLIGFLPKAAFFIGTTCSVDLFVFKSYYPGPGVKLCPLLMNLLTEEPKKFYFLLL